MRKHTRKQFNEKIKWFIDNKHKLSRERRSWYINGLEERYGDMISYEKYGYYGDGMVEYINDKIIKLMKRNV